MTAGLAAARALLASGAASWPRGCAFLVRMELEEWVRRYSATLDINLAQASMRSQLLCLDKTVTRDQSSRAAYAWHRLSEACHQHAYELAPTVGELHFLLEEVESLLASDSPDIGSSLLAGVRSARRL